MYRTLPRQVGRIALALPLCAVTLATARAQQSPAVTQVLPDRRVVFRLEAPKAAQVRVEGGYPLPKAYELARDDSGVWSVTVGPLEPEVYTYHFVVDGSLRILDPRNPDRKGLNESLLVVPAESPRAWEDQNVPHGTIHVHTYRSRSLGVTRRLHVYTPPGYERSGKTRYPVLYLLHGSGDDDSMWTSVGRADRIVDSLLAQRRAIPFVVVMPNGHVPQAEERTGGFERDLLSDVIPLIEGAYRVKTDPASRAIVGLSMGGFQAMQIGFGHPEQFGAVGILSAGIRDEPAMDRDYAKFLKTPTVTGGRTRLVYVWAGKDDFLLRSAQSLDAWLTRHAIRHLYQEAPGPHDWPIWRHALVDLAPRLFQYE